MKTFNILMMNTSKKFLKDATNIFSSVPKTGKLIIRTIAAECALKFSYAQLVSIPTNQIGRRTAIARQGGMVSSNVLHDSHQID
ncbi:hypothetical protein [Niastella yeongjuensis]|uniref:hypothetical protein n=1 Tax=Niastella yeongjuensis TaxID=354355 RepID=UPI0010559730|nr:hypothetical protein [Niastella yeongjuensis]